MESFSSYFDGQSSTGNPWRSDTLKNFTQISPLVQNHLKLVYVSLCSALLASAVGVYVHILWNIGGLLTTIACMANIIWLTTTPSHEEKKKVSLLMGAAFFKGASIGPLIDFAISMDPSILMSAYLGTAMAFGVFSARRMFARQPEYQHPGGLQSAGVSILLCLQFASFIVGGSAAMFKLGLCFGLLVFVGYLFVVTQQIIEKAHNGDLDYVNHALTLYTDFTDFVAVFVQILMIMLKNSWEKKEQKKKRKNKKNKNKRKN